MTAAISAGQPGTGSPVGDRQRLADDVSLVLPEYDPAFDGAGRGLDRSSFCSTHRTPKTSDMRVLKSTESCT